MLKNLKVLVVDDEEEIRNFFRRTLEFDGYQVLTANGGKDGVNFYRRENPDIVLLDIKMADLNGIETLRQIREIDSQQKSTIIMLTGHGDIDTARQAMELGAYDYITKPFDLNFLNTLIEEAAREKKCEN